MQTHGQPIQNVGELDVEDQSAHLFGVPLTDAAFPIAVLPWAPDELRFAYAGLVTAIANLPAVALPRLPHDFPQSEGEARELREHRFSIEYEKWQLAQEEQRNLHPAFNIASTKLNAWWHRELEHGRFRAFGRYRTRLGPYCWISPTQWQEPRISRQPDGSWQGGGETFWNVHVWTPSHLRPEASDGHDGRPIIRSDAPPDVAIEWMRAAYADTVETKPKSEDAIRDCMAAKGVNYREAKSALALIENRNKRGRPRGSRLTGQKK